MTLAFSTQLNGKPTHFVEKIWEAILRNGVECNANDLAQKLQEAMYILGKYTIGTYPAKLHTIREDKSNRWKAGNKIHFVINNRTPKRLQFAPKVKCESVQKIEVNHYDSDGFPLTNPIIHINGVWATQPTINKLAVNDGFDNAKAFFEYFKKDFTGKIIHWTNLKY